MTIQYHVFETAFGATLGAFSPVGVCFLQFGESIEILENELRGHFPNEEAVRVGEREHRLIEPLRRIVDAAIDGRDNERSTLPIDTRGSAFQRMVWDYLRSIPPGEVRSYSEVARALTIPRATRAVANACGANSIALLIPCHRVVRSDGSLGGYRWGPAVKQHLLAAERAARQARVTPIYQGNKVTGDIPETT